MTLLRFKASFIYSTRGVSGLWLPTTHQAPADNVSVLASPFSSRDFLSVSSLDENVSSQPLPNVSTHGSNETKSHHERPQNEQSHDNGKQDGNVERAENVGRSKNVQRSDNVERDKNVERSEDVERSVSDIDYSWKYNEDDDEDDDEDEYETDDLDDMMMSDFVQLANSKGGKKAFKNRNRQRKISRKDLSDYSYEYRVKRSLLNNYDKTTRPVRNDSTTTILVIGMSLYHILDTVSTQSHEQSYSLITTSYISICI